MTDTAWRDGIQAVHEEAAGVLHLHIVNAIGAVELIGMAMAGDAAAAGLMRAVTATVEQVMAAPRARPMICACCPRLLEGTKFSVGVAVPATDDPCHAIGFGICETCSEDISTLPAKAARALRSIWPDGRLVDLHEHMAGHA